MEGKFMVRKRSPHRTATTVTSDGSPVILALNEEEAFAELRSCLVEINQIPGVKGYILRNSTTAAIDLQKTEKLVEYALFLSETVDCLQEVSDLFSLNATRAVVEGKELNMLCMIKGGNHICVFVEEYVDPDDIFKRISS
jgi:hypothetical protein